MVNLTYRISDSEAAPSETTIKGAPLTNYEIDANFKAIVDDLSLKAYSDEPTFTGTVTFDTTGAVTLPLGSTEQRPEEAVPGMMRINTDYGYPEYYNDGTWSSIASGATGAKNDQIFYLNDQVVNYDYSIPERKNAMTAGKVTLADGVTVSIPESSRLIVL